MERGGARPRAILKDSRETPADAEWLPRVLLFKARMFHVNQVDSEMER